MKINGRKIAGRALELLYPRICPVCGRILSEHDHTMNANPYICGKCYKELNFPSGPRCLKCSRPLLDDLQEYCSNCSKDKKYFDQGIALMIHDGAAKKILYDLKFSNKRDNADMLAFEAAQRCREQIAFWDPDIMVPVPLYRKKKRERGFNQAELLSVRLSFCLRDYGMSIPVRTDILERVSSTKPMKTLDSRERKENIRGAFRVVTGKDQIADIKSVMLVDDIYTSGATMSECAGVLKRSGISRVYFLTFSTG